MKINDKKLVFFNIVWGIASGVLSYIINFLLTPVITNRLGIEAYGFVSLGNQIISYVNILSVGINSFSARYIGEAYHSGDYEKANSFYSSVMGANFILAMIVLGTTIAALFHLDSLINIPESMSKDVKLLFLVLAINYFIGLIGGVFSSIAFLKNKMSGISKIKGVSILIYALLIIIIIRSFELKVYYVALANAFVTFIILFGNMYYAKRVAPEMHIEMKKFDISKVKQLISAGIYNSINSLGGTLGSGLDLIITNLMLSVTTMGQIAVGNQIGGILNTIITLIANAFQPKQLEAYTKGNIDELMNWMEAAMKLCSIVSLVFWGGFVFLGKQFYALWIPDQDISYIYKISLIVILGNLIVAIVTPLFYVTTLTIKMRLVCFVTLLCGMVNVLSMLILLNFFNAGAYIVVGTTAVLDIVSLVVFPIITKKYLSVDIHNIIILILRHFFVAIVLWGIYLLTPIKPYAPSWLIFMAEAVVFGILILGVVSFMVLNKEDRKKIKFFILNNIRGKA